MKKKDFDPNNYNKLNNLRKSRLSESLIESLSKNVIFRLIFYGFKYIL